MASDNNTSEEGPAFLWNWRNDTYHALAARRSTATTSSGRTSTRADGAIWMPMLRPTPRAAQRDDGRDPVLVRAAALPRREPRAARRAGRDRDGLVPRDQLVPQGRRRGKRRGGARRPVGQLHVVRPRRPRVRAARAGGTASTTPSGSASSPQRVGGRDHLRGAHVRQRVRRARARVFIEVDEEKLEAREAWEFKTGAYTPWPATTTGCRRATCSAVLAQQLRRRGVVRRGRAPHA